MRIVINGAGVAGPALAYWLRRSRHDVLLIERAPELRRGGYLVDFWGLGYQIADAMGLIPQIRRAGYQVAEVRFVDRRGRKAGGFSTAAFDRITGHRFTSTGRSDLAATIFHALDAGVEARFGDSIATISDRDDGVRVTFEHEPPREVDLVIGADGLHSRVRELAFGSVGQPEVPLGYSVAAFEIDGYRPRDELVYVTYGVPGRQVSRFAARGDKTLAFFMFRDEYLPREPAPSHDPRLIVDFIFRDLGWECAQLVNACRTADQAYFDRVSQIRMNRWTKGRVALIGDAAACISLLGGEGTGLALIEAYVLAGELAQRGADYRAAFEAYQTRLMPFLAAKQRMARRFAASFIPKTAAGVAFRDLMTLVLRVPRIADWFFRREFRDEIALPEYPRLTATAVV